MERTSDSNAWPVLVTPVGTPEGIRNQANFLSTLEVENRRDRKKIQEAVEKLAKERRRTVISIYSSLF